MSTPQDKTKKFQVFTLFDEKECDKIVRDVVRAVKPKPAEPAEQGVQENVRTTTVYTIPKNDPRFLWIYQKINPAIKDANKSWEFDVAGFEDLQLLEYKSKTSYFDWHLDGMSPNTYRRKMGFSVMMSSPDSFKGGELQFRWRNEVYTVPPENWKQGQMVIFPSFLLHRVKGMVSGTRYVLVSWVNGKDGWK